MLFQPHSHTQTLAQHHHPPESIMMMMMINLSVNDVHVHVKVYRMEKRRRDYEVKKNKIKINKLPLVDNECLMEIRSRLLSKILESSNIAIGFYKCNVYNIY